MKLGAARARRRAAWRLIDVDVAAKRRHLRFALNRKKLRQVRRREGRYLLRTNLCGQEPAQLWQFYIQLIEIEAAFKNLKDDLAIAPDLSPARAAHRSAHLRRLPGLLPARHLAGKAQATGPRAHAAGRARQIRRDPNARRPFSDDRWPHADLEPLDRLLRQFPVGWREQSAALRHPETTRCTLSLNFRISFPNVGWGAKITRRD